MCGRFTLRTRADVLIDIFQAAGIPDAPLRYNIAPTQQISALIRDLDSGGRIHAWLRWGLVPAWAKDQGIGSRMINARSETVADKPAFRTAFRRRRCLVLADGYYEWVGKSKPKQPYYIRMADESPFAFAGLWERWQDPETETPLDSCTIITTESNELTKPIHHRMPVILPAQAHEQWLDTREQAPDRLLPLLRPFPSEPMRADMVSTLVNSPRNDSAACIKVQQQLF